MGKKMKWADVVKLGVTVKAKTNKPLLSYQSDNFDMLRIVVQSTGGQFFKPDGSLNLHSEAFRKSLGLFKELNDKGLLYSVVGWSDWINAINSDQSRGLPQRHLDGRDREVAAGERGQVHGPAHPADRRSARRGQRLQQRRLKLVRLLLQPQQGRSPSTS